MSMSQFEKLMPSAQSDHINSLLKNEFVTEKLLQNIDKNQQYEAVISLLNNITQEKEKVNDKLFIITAAYDKIYKKYNGISLVVLVLSSIATLFEALRLSIVDYIEKQQPLVDIETISFIMNLIILFIGTIITISSSIIRFRNYREILEQLKDSQAILISYRDKYNKKYQKVLNLLALDTLGEDEIQHISEKISEYDDAIKSVNVLQYLRNDEIIKFNKYKAFFDFQLRKIDIDKQIAINKYENLSGIKDMDKPPPNIDARIGQMRRLSKVEMLKKFIKSKTKSTHDVNEIVVDDLQNL